MKEFEVTIKQKIEYETSVWVEAKDKESAVKQAKSILAEQDITLPEMPDHTIGDVFEKTYHV